ncbi:glycosyltransferase 61 family protein [Shimia sp. SDUM112013]|uniref:glycosyltransferase 61 family protein n=1 Tax=Shimia sp. SDUM112013 TaxID=3136160 RepID=UPI0032EBA7AD
MNKIAHPTSSHFFEQDKNLAQSLELLSSRARARVKDEANKVGVFLEDLDVECRALSDLVKAQVPITSEPISFDRPTNLYVVSEIYQTGGHGKLIKQMIATRPQERHIVLFTGAFENSRQFGIESITAAGGFPIYPDPSLGKFDRMLWLREKLSCFVAQRLFILPHPEDVLAAVALSEFAGGYGKRAYVVHHADTVASVGLDLETATHIAIRPEQKERILDLRQDYSVHVLPLSFNPELLDPPIQPELTALIEKEDRDFFATGSLITATCGGYHKFLEKGELGLPKMIARILNVTHGRHLHIGPLTDSLRKNILAELKEEGISSERLWLVNEVRSVAETLLAYKVGLFVTSFPIGGGLTIVEAAYAGIPIAVYGGGEDEASRYTSGLTHAPNDVLVWEDPDQFSDLLASFWQKSGTQKLRDMSASSRLWFNSKASGTKFSNRLRALINATEVQRPSGIGENRETIIKALLDTEHYLGMNPDLVESGVEPYEHYLLYGESEHRVPNPLFDPGYYLSQLSSREHKLAEDAPLTHYIERGESRGIRPHVLFDPLLCRTSMAEAGIWEPATGDAVEDSILVRYLKARDRVRPHMFFDPRHYSRQAKLVPEGQPLLVHYLTSGAQDGLSPHPLIKPDLIAPRGPDQFTHVLNFICGVHPAKNAITSSRIFDPECFGQRARSRYPNAAPNLLWAHLIEGNLTEQNPHPLISITHVERMRPGTLVAADTVLRHAARNDLDVDTHPLVQRQHILKQAPFVSTLPITPTEYFIESGAAHNIDPHPLFSVQHYLFKYPDLRANSMNPLVHFLRHGEKENRVAHPAFDTRHYFQSFLGKGGGSAILDYLSKGMSLFHTSLPMNEGLRDISRKTAIHLFEMGGDDAAADMLASSMHPDTAPENPMLVTETRQFTCGTEGAQESREIFPEETVFVDRPSVVSQTHIAPKSGEYLAPAGSASVYHDATLVPGNDGFISEDGQWVDPGLVGFDPEIMRVKENAAVVSVANGKVLLRRYRSAQIFPTGILASGTYSHNYFHFLMEVLPRILLAVELAPRGTPILADQDMPDQHYQALRLFLPEYPVLRLARNLSVKVGRLFVGSMPNLIHDAFENEMPPADALRFHPIMVRKIAELGRALSTPEDEQHLYLRRDGAIRKILNPEEVQNALVTRGFDVVRCGALHFADQVQLFGRARCEIVAQSGAHLTNMLFAPESSRILALFSNAKGTNFYLWSALGKLLGHEVINIAGWRVAGSAPGNVPEAHEDFTVPTNLITPFYPHSQDLEEVESDTTKAHILLNELFDLNHQADVVTGAWGILSTPTPDGFNERVIEMRAQLGELLMNLEQAEIDRLLGHGFFAHFYANVRSGFFAINDFGDDEVRIIEEIKSYFDDLSKGESGLESQEADDDGNDEEGDGNFARMLAAAMLYVPAWQLPLVADIGQIEERYRGLYLNWLSTPPVLFRDGDDAGYVGFVATYLDWLAVHLAPENPMAVRKMIADTAARIDLGQLLLVGEPLKPVLAARNRLLEQVASRTGPLARQKPRPDDLSQGRIRVGILCRTFAKGPDSEAVAAFFKSFDHKKFEVFAYSVGFHDRVVAEDEQFDRVFDKAIDHRRIVSNDPHDMRETILADDLDVFLYANATTFGVREQEIALYHRVAPIQMVLNSHLPMSPGFPSFDYFLTGLSDDAAAEVSDEDYFEKILRIDGPVINYLNSLKPKPKPTFDRASLGLGEDDFVMINGGSSQKLRHECLVTMLRALAEVPNGKLLFAPYNPGWAGRSQAFVFNRQLTEAAEEVGISLDNVIVLSELSVAEAEAALSLSDIYLSSFPHGGATMTHLALIYGTPPIVLRRRNTRSIDQFLVKSLGFDQTLASTPDDYVTLVGELARDRAGLEQLSRDIQDAAKNPIFVANPDFSLAMQDAIVDALNTFDTRNETGV